MIELVSPERTKEISLALKLHFTSNSYNYVKYNGKTRSGSLKQQDSWYTGLSKRLRTEENVKQFFLSNIIKSYADDGKLNVFLRSFNNKDGFDNWKNWQDKIENIKLLVKEELKNINNNDFKVDNYHPLVYTKFLNHEVSIETISYITIHKPSILEGWKLQQIDPILFPEFIRILEKYNVIIMNYLAKGENIKERE